LSEAWRATLAGLTGWNREQWAFVLLNTRPTRRSAYYRGGSSRVDSAMSELASYAADAGLDSLRYEPVA
jgi:hypothetical protein